MLIGLGGLGAIMGWIFFYRPWDVPTKQRNFEDREKLLKARESEFAASELLTKDTRRLFPRDQQASNNSETETRQPARNVEEMLLALRELARKTDEAPEVLAFAGNNLLSELQQVGPPAIEQICREVLETDNPLSFRILLIELLGSIAQGEDSRIAGTLKAVIENKQESDALRLQALQWIGKVGTYAELSFLLGMLEETRDQRYEFALTRSISDFQNVDDDVISILTNKLQNFKHYLTPVAAIRGLKRKQSDQIRLIVREELFKEISRHSESPIEMLKIQHLVHAAGELQDSQSLETLARILEDPKFDVSVRSAAAEALGMLNSEEARVILLERLKRETDESVLVYIARAFSVCGHTEDGPILSEKSRLVSDDFTASELRRVAKSLALRRPQ